MSGPAARHQGSFAVFLRTWRFSRAAVAGIIMPTKPTIIEIDMSKLEDILRRVEANDLTEDDCATLRTLCESYVHLLELLKNKNTSIGRLRKLLFGAKSEKIAAVIASLKDSQPPSDAAASEGNADGMMSPQPTTEAEKAAKEPPKGHGRNGADAYVGAVKVAVPHPSLRPGDSCPHCGRGTICQKKPGVLVRFVGQAPIQATVYELQKLRCNLCGDVFPADPPAGVGTEKYDATAGSMIAMLKYSMGVPFHREAQFQECLGIPVPASTQWEVVEEKAKRIEPAFQQLVRQAANDDVVFNDDTNVRILELRDKRAAKGAVTQDAAEDSMDDDETTDRRGMYTTGIVSTGEGHKIALFFSGRQHAGENLKDVLVRRAKDLPPPTQMCDALSRNLPGKLQTILGNCLAHGRRRFTDVFDHFPEECRHVLEALAVVYHNDELARDQEMSPQQRLEFHQRESGPVMGELHVWLAQQLDDRLVEPNSGLGTAISFLLKHWEKLTLFLRVPGAPLDNNICERALKKAIRHRRNSLFYKTCHGAHVGDIFMSLIHTCELNGANPFDYLTELERHADEVAANPQDWMPWNFRQTLGSAAASPTAL
jgi:transposase